MFSRRLGEPGDVIGASRRIWRSPGIQENLGGTQRRCLAGQMFPRCSPGPTTGLPRPPIPSLCLRHPPRAPPHQVAPPSLPLDGAMSSTSQKHRDFVAEPMGEKPVGTLAGIGDVLGKKLEEKGFDKAYVVLGQFLVLRKDEELFREWLKETCGANAKQSRDCSGCLREWCDAFL
ncbi:LOW QUALITY PROTEIN: barrier-to-autointegration factor [Haliaeetus albicilla]|uniref:LOW QUALITY PROTEIN: barrier-to-autointegration factor n=1 Tax=Haliaeetus albicilla TaxID=8969 RepID=UPI0037E8ABC9